MQTRVALSVVVMGLFGQVGAWAAGPPAAVSPGWEDVGAVVESRCPTFSWGLVPGAESYELIVYELPDDGEDPQPVVRQRFPGSVPAWTPAVDRCLERGGQYAWTVRAIGEKGKSDWSAPRLFDVASGPSEAELESALAVVREHLEREPARPEGEPAPSVQGSKAADGPRSTARLHTATSAAPRRAPIEGPARAVAPGPVVPTPPPSLALSLGDDLLISTDDTPLLRLDQDGSGIFVAYAWDVAANETYFAVADATAGTRPFQISSGAPTGALQINSTTSRLSFLGRLGHVSQCPLQQQDKEIHVVVEL